MSRKSEASNFAIEMSSLHHHHVYKYLERFLVAYFHALHFCVKKNIIFYLLQKEVYGQTENISFFVKIEAYYFLTLQKLFLYNPSITI